ncbi:MAG TPA: hypothetical protein VM286_03120 [Candidatus Thermoplasmatota archaeon]|nr:hypothetical protein [Candidatus Thermoplasmatota archaeon]
MAQAPVGAHCPQCATYEDAVISRTPGEPFPATVLPCDSFAMSDRFRDWAVAQMRAEVGGQVSGAGLDRMALLKGKTSTASPAPATASARKLTARKRKGSPSGDVSPKDPGQR